MDGRERGVLLVAPRDVEVDVDAEEEDGDAAGAVGAVGRRALEREAEVDAEQVEPADLEVERAADHRVEVEGRELEQDVEADLPADVRRVDAEEEVGVGAELDGVRRDREVGLDLDLRPVVVEDADRQAPERRQVERRRVEGRVEAPDREQEARVVAPLEADGHVAFERDEDDPRLVEAGVEREQLLVEVEDPDEVDLDEDDRLVLFGEGDLEHAEDRDVSGRDLDDDPERERHERRRPPPDLRHRPDEERPLLRREDRLEVADDLRRVRDRVRGEHDAVDRSRADAVAQDVEEDGAVEAEEAADAVQREAEAELDRRELGADDDEQREARGAVRQLRRHEADRLDGHDLGDRELGDARVLALVGIEVEVAAALDDRSVDGEAGAARRLEPETEVERAELRVRAAREPQLRECADAVDRDRDRAERAREAGRDLERDRPVGLDPEHEVDDLELDRPERLVDRDRDLDAAARGHTEAGVRLPLKAEVELALDVRAREQLRDEAVGVRAADLQRDAVEVREEQRVDVRRAVGDVPRRGDAQPCGEVVRRDQEQPAGAGEEVERPCRLGAVGEDAELALDLPSERLEFEVERRRQQAGDAAGHAEVRRDADAPLLVQRRRQRLVGAQVAQEGDPQARRVDARVAAHDDAGAQEGVAALDTDLHVVLFREELPDEAEEVRRVEGRAAPPERVEEVGAGVVDQVLELVELKPAVDVAAAQPVARVTILGLPVEQPEELQPEPELGNVRGDRRGDRVVAERLRQGLRERGGRGAIGGIRDGRRRHVRVDGVREVVEGDEELPEGDPELDELGEDLQLVVGGRHGLDGRRGGLHLRRRLPGVRERCRDRRRLGDGRRQRDPERVAGEVREDRPRVPDRPAEPGTEPEQVCGLACHP